jgi:TonB-dependent receptor
VRFFNYVENGGNFETGTGNVPDPKNPTRYFRNLDENNRNLKLDLTVPFRHWREQEGIFKTGVYDSQSKRTFIDREVFYQGNEPFNGDPNAYLNPATFGYTATTNNLRNIIFDWRRYVQTRDSAYEGEFKVRAAYVMLDAPLITLDRPLSLFGVPFFEGLRLVGGVRNESTDLSIDSRSYLANSITGQSTNSSRLEQTDLLPAAGLIWSVRTNMNIRVSYSQTIARPSFRELAGYRSYDPVLDVLLDGNPALKMSAIENWDIRWEWFPRPGEFFSVSLFTKDLKDAIERRFVTTDGEIVSFANRETAKVYGIEFEARRSLDFIHRDLSLFSLGGNLSLIGSETPLTREEIVAKESVFGPGNFDKERTLYDQSPYILNLDLTYDNPRIGTTASLLYNTAGPRVSIASLNTEDIYEQPAPTLDILLAQKLGRSLGVRFTARNLLNPRIERTYGKSGDLLFSSYRRGLTFGLSLSYEF